MKQGVRSFHYEQHKATIATSIAPSGKYPVFHLVTFSQGLRLIE